MHAAESCVMLGPRFLQLGEMKPQESRPRLARPTRKRLYRSVWRFVGTNMEKPAPNLVVSGRFYPRIAGSHRISSLSKLLVE